MSEPQNVGSIVATALAGARARIEWAAEGQVGEEELTVLFDLVTDLEGWQARWGEDLAKFQFKRDIS